MGTWQQQRLFPSPLFPFTETHHPCFFPPFSSKAECTSKAGKEDAHKWLGTLCLTPAFWPTTKTRSMIDNSILLQWPGLGEEWEGLWARQFSGQAPVHCCPSHVPPTLAMRNRRHLVKDWRRGRSYSSENSEFAEELHWYIEEMDSGTATRHQTIIAKSKTFHF